MYTQEQLDLKAYIEQSNAKFIADCKAKGSTFICTPVSDIDHWAECGIFNIAQYEHSSAVGIYMDVYKDVHGVKPRWMNFNQMTTEEIYQELDNLTKQAELQRLDEEAYEAEQKRLHQERKKLNSYKPNLPFANLKSLMSTAK